MKPNNNILFNQIVRRVFGSMFGLNVYFQQNQQKKKKK